MRQPAADCQRGAASGDGDGDGPMTLSPSLAANPLISTWLTVRADGTVTLRVGKAELGQGIHTALAQIAVTELGLSPGQLTVAPLSTAASPDEGFTAGS